MKSVKNLKNCPYSPRITVRQNECTEGVMCKDAGTVGTASWGKLPPKLGGCGGDAPTT